MWQIRIWESKAFWENNYDAMTLLTETDLEPCTDGVIEVDGKIYRFNASSPRNKVMCVTEVTWNGEPGEEYGDDFKCPYCGEIDHDAWELSADEDKTECEYCGSEIEYQRHIEVSYTITPVKRSKVSKIS